MLGGKREKKKGKQEKEEGEAEEECRASHWNTTIRAHEHAPFSLRRNREEGAERGLALLRTQITTFAKYMRTAVPAEQLSVSGDCPTRPTAHSRSIAHQVSWGGTLIEQWTHLEHQLSCANISCMGCARAQKKKKGRLAPRVRARLRQARPGGTGTEAAPRRHGSSMPWASIASG